ncbi:MAG: hypothetical protein IKV82_01590 [Akkermansia sp.]|nr:hypothetical protein [Akkermansia sp.]
MASTHREYGVDLLRIIAMFMICMIHVNFFAWFSCPSRCSSIPFAFSFASEWTEGVGIIGVNLYALITGYVCVNTEWKLARLVKLWGTVIFYALLFVGAYCVLEAAGYRLSDSSYSNKDLCSLMCVVASGKPYWYFAAYIGVFFVSPFINKAVKAADKRTMKYLLLLLLFLFPALNLYCSVFYANAYTFLWLAVLYTMGAYVKCHAPVFPRTSVLLTISAVSSTQVIFESMLEVSWFLSYACPVSVLYAVSLFVVFTRINITNVPAQRLISWAAPAAFSVYLIQCHPWCWKFLMFKCPIWAESLNYPACFPFIVGGSLYIVCTLIDRMRIVLFTAFRIDKLLYKLGDSLQSWGERVLTRFIRS